MVMKPTSSRPFPSARPDGAHPQRNLIDEVVEDRDVVRRQVPEGVDVGPKRAQVRPRSIEVVHLPERPAIDQHLDVLDALVGRACGR